jgi:hypothetical protein
VSGLSARNAANGTIATIVADDAALPEPAVTPERSGTKLVTQPIPGTNSQLTWKLGATPAPAPRLTLTLTDVAGMTVDMAQAALSSGTVAVTSDGPAALTLADLPDGTTVLKGGTRLATVGASGGVTVAIAGGETTLTVTAPSFACTRPTGTLTSDAVGPVMLGMTRPAARGLFAQTTTAGRVRMDFFCRHDGGIRVGYTSSGRVALILTANRHFALDGVRPGTRLTRAVARRLHAGTGYPIGLNTWYLTPNGDERGVLKVQHGVIDEVGVADAALTESRRATRRFLTSFR